jgi:hypothetical protein
MKERTIVPVGVVRGLGVIDRDRMIRGREPPSDQTYTMNESSRPPESHELPALLHHWEYEAAMLRETGKRLVADGGLGTVERNALLESFILHARLLTEFYLDNPRKDDVVAMHFVADWADQQTAEAVAWLVDRVEQWHKWMAHLTATRVRQAKPGQPIGQIDAKLALLHRRFVTAVSKSPLAVHLRPELRVPPWPGS